ncbi:MAG: FAD-dependent oxidoreductase [Luteitalea sp.]|nr:FAD-dependent oxidoreductase [Luteitalea sp.]
MKRRDFLPLLVGPLVAPWPSREVRCSDRVWDLVVYGGTAGGIVAAISAAREGASVTVLEPTDHVGGMVTGGLGWTDIGIGATIGGMAAEFYRRVFKHYEDPAAWKFESREQFLDSPPTRARHISGDKWWHHEPSVASAIFQRMLQEAGVTLLTAHRLAAVEKRGPRIIAIRCANDTVFAARVFIDATYEGDLMAMAGVSYRVGRESRDEYGEPLAGVVPVEKSTRKQWDVDISPYDERGKLMFGVQTVPRGAAGAGDRKVQAYNFRICLTDHAPNRLPIDRPANYDASCYDLLARYIAAKPTITLRKGLLKIDRLPNRKTDINDGGPFSTDFLGESWDYPEADGATRRRIIERHLDYTQGLLYFIGHDTRVPPPVRDETRQWGYPRDEYLSTGHFSPQLYIREARRMVGAHVMSSHDIDRRKTKHDVIGLASYGPDSHLVTRIVDERGFVRNEGNPNDFTGGHRAYEVPYRSITPRAAQCDNLLVTFCVSASHMAFASIRMEPVFMILSESAGVAAIEAARSDVSVQRVSYAALRSKLLERGQLLKVATTDPNSR